MHESLQPLSPRLETILRWVTDYYLEHAKPIGSKTLLEAFRFPWSSATIRNEMAQLETLGLLCRGHISAGRIPTAQGIRYFVDHLLTTEEIADGVKEGIDHSLDESGRDPLSMLRYVSQSLSRISRNVSLVLMMQGPRKDYMIGGKENLLGQPEFSDSLKLKDLFRILEEEEVQEHLFRRSVTFPAVSVTVGERELNIPYGELFEDVSVVAAAYSICGRAAGVVSVIGPKRMDYRHTIPLVDYMAKSMERSLVAS